LKRDTPRPFLKWVGGKGQLLPQLSAAIGQLGAFGRYHEPFLGGGALFFALARERRLAREAFLSDINPNLVDAYLAIQHDVDALVERLLAHKREHCEAHYYRVREHVPQALVDRAARIIYLNKTCFNGLYRENSKGKFNVPFGRYVNPGICDEENLRAVAHVLRNVEVRARGFESAIADVRAGDFVYCDPPYVPVSATSYFTSYSRGGFDATHQEQLAREITSLAERGAHVMLSNSATELTSQLYRDFHVTPVLARRSVNSRTDRRGEVREMLVTTFPVDTNS
jgi:DNA adenine methylase